MTDEDEKVVELQIKISNIEKSLDELSDMMAQQWRIIDGQKQKIASLESQLEGKQDREGSNIEPPPPHY